MEKNQYIKIYEQVKRQITRGQHSIGTLLPPEKVLAKQFRVSRPTVARAMSLLKNEGLIRRRAGSGTYVNKVPEKTFWNVGLLIPHLGETEIFEPICRKMAAFSDQEDIQLYWTAGSAYIKDKRELALQLCQTCIDQHLDGVFFAPVEHVESGEEVNTRILNELTSAGIRTVLLDRDIVPWPGQTACDLVGIDNIQAGFVVARHLIEQGCRSIAFATRPRPAMTVQLRIMGCREAMLQAGLQPSDLVVHELDMTEPQEAIGIIRRGNPDGLVCANDATAAILLRSLVDAGVSIPEDLRVAAFDDVRYASLLSVPLTTYHQPCPDIGLTAVQAMRARLLHPERPARRIFLKGELIIRESSSRLPLVAIDK
jgi:DNA-binding LacI/PurR family transcriptional regulator